MPHGWSQRQRRSLPHLEQISQAHNSLRCSGTTSESNRVGKRSPSTSRLHPCFQDCRLKILCGKAGVPLRKWDRLSLELCSAKRPQQRLAGRPSFSEYLDTIKLISITINVIKLSLE